TEDLADGDLGLRLRRAGRSSRHDQRGSREQIRNLAHGVAPPASGLTGRAERNITPQFDGTSSLVGTYFMSVSVDSSSARVRNVSGSGNGLSGAHCLAAIMVSRRDSKMSRNRALG